jgi:hypothetical protein
MEVYRGNYRLGFVKYIDTEKKTMPLFVRIRGNTKFGGVGSFDNIALPIHKDSEAGTSPALQPVSDHVAQTLFVVTFPVIFQKDFWVPLSYERKPPTAHTKKAVASRKRKRSSLAVGRSIACAPPPSADRRRESCGFGAVALAADPDGHRG